MVLHSLNWLIVTTKAFTLKYKQCYRLDGIYFGRLFSVAQWSVTSRRAQDWWASAVTLFCLSNNSDVEVILIAAVSTLCATPTWFVCFSQQTRRGRSISSLSCGDSERHRPRIIGAHRHIAFRPSLSAWFQVVLDRWHLAWRGINI
jgi:hypothetical protein